MLPRPHSRVASAGRRTCRIRSQAAAPPLRDRPRGSRRRGRRGVEHALRPGEGRDAAACGCEARRSVCGARLSSLPAWQCSLAQQAPLVGPSLAHLFCVQLCGHSRRCIAPVCRHPLQTATLQKEGGGGGGWRPKEFVFKVQAVRGELGWRQRSWLFMVDCAHRHFEEARVCWRRQGQGCGICRSAASTAPA
jgi:hypothetical protein